MHGRVKKDLVELSAEEKAKQREQVCTARSLFGKLLDLRGRQSYDEQALEMTSKALQFHPEFPTLWGYRRELLTKLESASLRAEIKLLEKALRKSQKVYSIWFHRKWVVEKLFREGLGEADEAHEVLKTELDLCNQLLQVDERNFHCWNHRMFVMDLMRTWMKGKEDAIDLNAIDLKLSTDLINKNFSNYSAWHLRTLLQQRDEPLKLNLEEELEWVQQGIYTEPNDQSVWLYHQWLTLGSETPRITHCALLENELFIFFSRPVSAQKAQVFDLEAPLEALPRRSSRTRGRTPRRWALAWRFTKAVAPEDTFQVRVMGSREETWHFLGPVNLRAGLGEGKEVLKQELERIDELLEIEPECKWALLARLRLQRACGKVAEETCLGDLDPLRRNFYADDQLEEKLRQRLQDWRSPEALQLSSMGLRLLAPSLAAQIFGVQVLNLDENHLQEFGALLLLESLLELSISKNEIRGHVAEIFILPRLVRVDLRYNRLSLGHGQPLPQLKEIYVAGNDLVAPEVPDERSSWNLQFGEK